MTLILSRRTYLVDKYTLDIQKDFIFMILEDILQGTSLSMEKLHEKIIGNSIEGN